MSDAHGEAHAVSVLRALGRKHALTIVRAAGDPVTIGQLTDEYGVPRTTCYRRLEELIDLGILTHHGTRVSADGHHCETYRRRLDRFDLDFAESLSLDPDSREATDRGPDPTDPPRPVQNS